MFISRRGLPKNMYSDNATNFVGAHNELKQLYSFFNAHVEEITKDLINFQINWHFIPSRSPHFGDLWEATVKIVKHYLKRVIGSTILTFEEFDTIIVQIEAIVNSRPLTPLSSDPSDLSPLTPAHFFIGRSLTMMPELELTSIPQNRLNKYQLLSNMIRSFWKRWHTEYLHQLQRPKWTTQTDELIKENSLVILKDENMPPTKWKMARIIELHPGKDNKTQVVTVKTSHGDTNVP